VAPRFPHATTGALGFEPGGRFAARALTGPIPPPKKDGRRHRAGPAPQALALESRGLPPPAAGEAKKWLKDPVYSGGVLRGTGDRAAFDALREMHPNIRITGRVDAPRRQTWSPRFSEGSYLLYDVEATDRGLPLREAIERLAGLSRAELVAGDEERARFAVSRDAVGDFVALARGDSGRSARSTARRCPARRETGSEVPGRRWTPLGAAGRRWAPSARASAPAALCRPPAAGGPRTSRPT
jgi:hypothetical protein